VGMIGANLAGLRLLGDGFASAGAEFVVSSGEIVSEVERVVEEFVVTMAGLRGDADSLGAEMSSSMGALEGRAASVAWTGSQRGRHDEGVASLVEEVRKVKLGVDAFSVEAQGIVDGKLVAVLGDLGVRVREYGVSAQGSADSFRAAIVSQGDSFDAVLNG
jgi:hypothetical protein